MNDGLVNTYLETDSNDNPVLVLAGGYVAIDVSRVLEDEELRKQYDEMKDRDAERLERTLNSRNLEVEPVVILEKLIRDVRYTRVWLEPRVGYPNPINYYQKLMVNGQPLSIFWRHDCLRGFDVENGQLILMSKHVDEKELYFYSYIYLEFAPDEFKVIREGPRWIVQGKKEANTYDGRSVIVEFSFVHNPIHRLGVAHSSTRPGLYNKYRRTTYKGNMSENVIPNNHVMFHPYILNMSERLGMERRELEVYVNNYVEMLLGGN